MHSSATYITFTASLTILLFTFAGRTHDITPTKEVKNELFSLVIVCFSIVGEENNREREKEEKAKEVGLQWHGRSTPY